MRANALVTAEANQGTDVLTVGVPRTLNGLACEWDSQWERHVYKSIFV